MRTLILTALLAIISFGYVSSARAYVCETSCDDGYAYGRGSGSAQCHTRCHN